MINWLAQLFFNLDMIKKIDKLPYIKEKFSKSLLDMDLDRKLKYAQNTKRLLVEKLDNTPKVYTPILVMTGEYDNFTSPSYCEEFAKMCKNYEFTLVDESDHFFHVEKPRTTIELTRTFLLGNDIKQIQGHSQFISNV